MSTEAPATTTDVLIEILAAEPGAAARLAVEHSDDGTGHCRLCSGGAQTGRYVWPCPLRGLADQAIKLASKGGRR